MFRPLQLQSLPSPPILMTSHSRSATDSLLNLLGISHHSYTAGPAEEPLLLYLESRIHHVELPAAAVGGEAAAGAMSPAALELASPFLNRIMGMCGLTVTNLRRMARLAETEDMMDGCEL